MTTIVDVPSLAAQARSFQPRPSLPDWMEQQIVLPANFGRPGPLHLDPWQRAIASRVGDPAVHHMSLQLPSQTFKSLFISGVVMYAAVHDIPAILAFPTGVLKGITAVSITEHTDDSPTGKLLMEAIIESMDELYSENLAQDVVRGMGEVYSIEGSAVGRMSARVPTPVSTANYGCPSFAD